MEIGQSQVKVPHSDRTSTGIEQEKGHREEGLSKFLAMHDDERTEDLAGQVVEEEEEQEKRKIQQQMKKNTSPPKQTRDSPDRRVPISHRETTKGDTKRDLFSMERQRVLQEAFLMRSRSEVIRMDKAIAAKDRLLQQLEQLLKSENSILGEFLTRIEKTSADAKILFEKENKSKHESNARIEKLTDETDTMKSELAKIEEILNKYKRYKNILFKLSPPEWQEAQEAKALKAKVPTYRNAQKEQKNSEPQETAIRQGSERDLESSPGRVQPPTSESTLVTDSKLDSESSGNEEKLELYFSDIQQLLDLVMELTDQDLSLIQNSTRVDETLEELQQNIETTLKKMKEDEDKLTLQVNDKTDRIDKEKERAANLKKKVQLHDSLKTADQDVLLNALDVKVTEVHRCCVDSRLTHLSTLEKLSSVEYRMSWLLQLIESIPEESLDTLRQIKDNERKSRLREEKLRLEREKQKEMMKKCMQRSLGDSKKIRGRKLMPRCIPVEQKIKVSEEDNIPAKDELHAYLFTTDDVQ